MENKTLMLISKDEGLRAAVLKGSVLYDLDIAHPGVEQKKSNIYKGRISRVEQSLDAVFVDYGPDQRQGFLPLKEISRNYFLPGFSGDFSNINIRHVVKEGQELIVQIEKEERGSKGAALTTFVSLAGSYVVLMPNNPRAGGISRRIEGQERDEMRETLRDLVFPEDMGIIVRSAGIGKSTEELQWDLNILLQLWNAVTTASSSRHAPFLIYQENDTALCAVRDYLKENPEEIIIDHLETYTKIRNYLQLVRPDFVDRVKLYEDKTPLFSLYRIEKQIESVYQRVIRLPSGGSIVFDYTEALISIDVNSARATGGSGIEETALNTNLEAANEIARQLRLRDLGGLIVIDFIDMDLTRNQRDVSQQLRNALRHDRARVQVGNITRFGLLEMSRQRLRPHIGEAIQITCPRCDGQGTIRSIESLANSIIHLVEEEATKERVAEVHVQVPTDLATYILNEKRSSLARIELQQEVRVLVLPNQHLETPKYRIKAFKNGELPAGGSATGGEDDSESSGSSSPGKETKNKTKNFTNSSYKLLETPDTEIPQKQKQTAAGQIMETPAVATTFAVSPAPSSKAKIDKNKSSTQTFVKKISQAIKTIFNKKIAEAPVSNRSNDTNNGNGRYVEKSKPSPVRRRATVANNPTPRKSGPTTRTQTKYNKSNTFADKVNNGNVIGGTRKGPQSPPSLSAPPPVTPRPGRNSKRPSVTDFKESLNNKVVVKEEVKESAIKYIYPPISPSPQVQQQKQHEVPQPQQLQPSQQQPPQIPTQIPTQEQQPPEQLIKTEEAATTPQPSGTEATINNESKNGKIAKTHAGDSKIDVSMFYSKPKEPSLSSVSLAAIAPPAEIAKPATTTTTSPQHPEHKEMQSQQQSLQQPQTIIEPTAHIAAASAHEQKSGVTPIPEATPTQEITSTQKIAATEAAETKTETETRAE